MENASSHGFLPLPPAALEPMPSGGVAERWRTMGPSFFDMDPTATPTTDDNSMPPEWCCTGVTSDDDADETLDDHPCLTLPVPAPAVRQVADTWELSDDDDDCTTRHDVDDILRVPPSAPAPVVRQVAGGYESASDDDIENPEDLYDPQWIIDNLDPYEWTTEQEEIVNDYYADMQDTDEYRHARIEEHHRNAGRAAL